MRDLEHMFYEYVVPFTICTVLLGFLCIMVGKGLDKPTVHELSESERAAIVGSWDN